LSQSQIDNGGYVIRTTIDDAKIAALYQAVQQNEAAMAQGGVPLPEYAHVGAVLENPADGAIEAMYPGPGYPGSRYVDYEGSQHTMTARECRILDCQVNMAVYNREQVGSSFKPYVLSTAVSEGMNVQTSMLNGFGSPLWIPPATDAGPDVYATPIEPPDAKQNGWYPVYNDDLSENGPYTPQMAMAASINTAYASLWQRAGADAVVKMAQLFGVDTAASGLDSMQDEAGVALGQASLTVGEQATMLATIDDGGVYHSAHVIKSITRNNAATPIKSTSYQVFSPNPTLNAEEATQVQYAMSEDTAPYGTAPGAALSNGQEIIAKTGTTSKYTAAFFIGAIPTDALAVGIFTDHPEDQFLPSDLGGDPQGGYGGTWPTAIWHTYGENMFVPLGVEQFQQPVFTGAAWNLVPPGLRTVPHKHKKHHQAGVFPPGQPFPPGNPNPYPTYSCDPRQVACNPNGPPFGAGNTETVTAAAGGAAAGFAAALPATCLCLRRRMRKQDARRG
jgi:membrane peptidoglycan carboxypeptidase